MSDKEYKPNIPLAELSALMQPEQYENRPLWETDPDFLNPYKELPRFGTILVCFFSKTEKRQVTFHLCHCHTVIIRQCIRHTYAH